MEGLRSKEQYYQDWTKKWKEYISSLEPNEVKLQARMYNIKGRSKMSKDELIDAVVSECVRYLETDKGYEQHVEFVQDVVKSQLMLKEDKVMTIKTLQGWRGTGDLENYLQIGDEVDDSLVRYFVNVLPPACDRSNLVQMGEPYSHVNGRPTFATISVVEGKWTYRGHCHRYETIQPIPKIWVDPEGLTEFLMKKLYGCVEGLQLADNGYKELKDDINRYIKEFSNT